MKTILYQSLGSIVLMICCLSLSARGHTAADMGEIFTSITQDELSVRGKVTEQQSGEPLPGVNVIVKGTSTGTVTDISGNYSINVPNEDDILVFS